MPVDGSTGLSRKDLAGGGLSAIGSPYRRAHAGSQLRPMRNAEFTPSWARRSTKKGIVPLPARGLSPLA